MRWHLSVSRNFYVLISSISDTNTGTFHKYLFLENMQLSADSPKSDICRCWLTSHASVHRPAYLL